MTEECLDAAGASHTVDLVNAFAVPISERVAARFIGLTEAETGELVSLIGPDRWVLDYIPKLHDFFARCLRKDKARPASSLWARMTSGPEDQRFDPAEAVTILALIWVAGTTTTGMLIASAACALLYQPAVRAEVLQHPDLIPALIEETMRLEAPEQTVWRRTRAATVLGGTQLPPGAEIRLHLGAANRDPAQFAHADSFILRRQKQANLAFGSGIHQCIGAGIARLTCRVALERLLARRPSRRSSDEMGDDLCLFTPIEMHPLPLAGIQPSEWRASSQEGHVSFCSNRDMPKHLNRCPLSGTCQESEDKSPSNGASMRI